MDNRYRLHAAWLRGRLPVAQAVTPPQSAFLALVRYSEDTARAPDPWRVCYRYDHTIISLADHPYPNEWKGVELEDHVCIAAGQQAHCISTAAGAYQIRHSTWLTLKARLNLPSFSQDCQDSAALEDIKSVGGLALINAGRIEDAIEACRGIWASLPGNPAKQPQRTFGELMDHYNESLEAVA